MYANIKIMKCHERARFFFRERSLVKEEDGLITAFPIRCQG